MGRRKKLTKNMVKKCITGSRGIILNVNKKLNVSYATLYNFFYDPENKDVLEQLNKEREKLVDFAEDKLYEKINSGDSKLIKFALNTLGKNRGYVERQEVHNTGTPVSINIGCDLSEYGDQIEYKDQSEYIENKDE